MQISKSEYLEWRNHPVTDAFIQYLESVISDSKDILAAQAGTNPLADKELVGGIAVCVDLIDWKPDMEDDDRNVH